MSTGGQGWSMPLAQGGHKGTPEDVRGGTHHPALGFDPTLGARIHLCLVPPSRQDLFPGLPYPPAPDPPSPASWGSSPSVEAHTPNSPAAQLMTLENPGPQPRLTLPPSLTHPGPHLHPTHAHGTFTPKRRNLQMPSPFLELSVLGTPSQMALPAGHF